MRPEAEAVATETWMSRAVSWMRWTRTEGGPAAIVSAPTRRDYAGCNLGSGGRLPIGMPSLAPPHTAS